MAIAGYPAGLVTGSERPGGVFAPAPNLALDLKSPILNFVRPVSKLAERNPHLHEPALVGDRGFEVPDRVPRGVPPQPSSRGHDLIFLDARWPRTESIGSTVIVVAVKHNREEISVRHRRIPPIYAIEHLSFVPQPGTDIDVIVIIEKTDLCLLADPLTFVGNRLEELGDRGRGHPYPLVQQSVNHDRLGRSNGLCPGGHRVVRIRRRRLARCTRSLPDRLGLLGQNHLGGTEEHGPRDRARGKKPPRPRHGVAPIVRRHPWAPVHGYSLRSRCPAPAGETSAPSPNSRSIM